MLFMVIEHFAPADVPEIYRRLSASGRQLPDGLRYLDSWVQADASGAFQLMECDDETLLHTWAASWDGLATFEFIPVTTSEAAQARFRAP